MSFHVTSFGRSFLWCFSRGRVPRSSLRFAVRALLAARHRWPAGRLVVSMDSVSWSVDGCCGVFVSGWRAPAPLFFLRAVRDARRDPFFPAPWYVAPFWVLRHWSWLRGPAGPYVG